MSSSQGPNPRGQDADGVAGLLGQRWGVPEGLHLGLRTGVGSTGRLSTNAPTIRNPQRVRVVLGAHRLQTPEPTQQRLGISRLIENNYNPQEKLNDVLLLQVGGRCRRCAPPSSASRCGREDEPGTNFGVCGTFHPIPTPFMDFARLCPLPAPCTIPRYPHLWVPRWLSG